MKVNTFIAFIFVSLALVFSADLYGQSKKKPFPTDTWGLGASVGGGNKIGGHFVYAIDKDMHFGADFGFFYNSGSGEAGQLDKDATTNVYFAPFFKYLFEPIKSIRPGIITNFTVSSYQYSEPDLASPGQTKVSSQTDTGIGIFVGGEWFPYRSVGVFAAVQVIKFQLDPSLFIIGPADAFIGIEWFF